jgi:hypothetical protein
MAKTTWKYTLREIIIVILGITIAFSMNKCADNVKDNKLRKEYLTNLKSDVEADKVQLNKNLLSIDEKLKICNQMLPLLNTEAEGKLRLMNMVFSVIKYETFSPKDITYKTMINSGDLKLIADFKLKSAIQTHYSNYDDVFEAYTRHSSLIRDYLGKYMINNADYDQIGSGKFPFKDEILLKNIVQALKSSYQEKSEATKSGVTSCDSIIEDINTEFNYM